MSTTFSVSCWMFLLSLAVVTPPSEAQGRRLSCCKDVIHYEIRRNITSCYKQEKVWGCKIDAYLIWVVNNKKPLCVDPNEPWLHKKMNVTTDCLPIIKLTGDRFVFMDDVE